MSQYATFAKFGGRIANKNVSNPENLTNPLTYCMVKTMDNAFLHGSESNFGPETYQCQNYMADKCANNWDGYCEQYVDTNMSLTYWPNNASISGEAYNKSNAVNHQSVGEQLLRNSLERRFIEYPYVKPQLEPFDTNDAASPYYKNYGNICGPLKYSVKNIDRKTIDRDTLMNKALANPNVCIDVLARIYLAYKSKSIELRGTQLEQFFRRNTALLEKWVIILFNQPGLDILRENNRQCILQQKC